MPDLTYPGPENIHRHVLPNGITILVYENFAAESVVIDGTLHAGALAESEGKAGLASFTASLLMRGTQQRSFGQIYEALESVGAGLDFSSGRHVTEFVAHCLVEDLDLVLELLSDSLRHPTFPAVQVELMRGEILTGLQIRANDTRRMAGLAFRELLYPHHPYGRSTQGYVETIPAITAEDMMQYHGRYFGPRDMIVGIVGAVKANEAIAKIEAALGDWQNPQQQTMTAVADVRRPTETRRIHVPMPDKSQSDILLGLPGPLRAAPDYLDAKMMNTILGVFGMMGRIGLNVREKQGLAYYAYSQLQGGLGPSPWFASAGVSPENVEQAIRSILDEVARIQDEPVSEEELADSQAYITGSMPVGLETNSGLVNVITDMEFYGLGLDYLQHYPDIIRAITPQRVQAAAQKYLSIEQIAIAVAGPESVISNQ
ncbi:MAG: insulinase family protein [Ardenticatenaceae bacterium]|nr:insulinase family protein [Anaerolineales bacterium]MCB8921371.1 insulinase family protein [Ardenticatenaceae bacterium]MCB8991493.1 insulinase family protein [Ardenticatenaceae bacterium]MCB9004005.1 insulinase family protein [Ardenticatenaceae bacterium]